MNKIWGMITAIFGIILGMFFFERGKRKDAEAEVENGEYRTTNAVTTNQVVQVEQSIEQTKTEAETKKSETKTDEELEGFLKKL